MLMTLVVLGFVYMDSLLSSHKKSSSESDDERSYSEKSLGAMKKKLNAMETKVLSWKALDDYNFMEEHFYDAVLQAEPEDNPHESVQIDQTDREDVQPWKELELLNQRKARPDDPALINHLRKYWIYPPCSNPYFLKNPDQVDFSAGQSAVVDKLFKQKVSTVAPQQTLINI